MSSKLIAYESVNTQLGPKKVLKREVEELELRLDLKSKLGLD